MYYYLIEQMKEREGNAFREKLANLTTDYGIAGEMVMLSPVKPIEMLIEIGVNKGYTTLVAVGSDKHIGKIITALMHRGAADRPVLGAIPTNPQSLVGQMLAIPNLKAALDALKYRRLAWANLAQIDPGKFILTQAVITTARPINAEIEVDRARIETPITQLTLAGDCSLEIRNAKNEPSILARVGLWLVGLTPQVKSVSLFHGQEIRINTAEPLTLTFEGEMVAQTPLIARKIPKALKIIVARANLSNETLNKTKTEEHLSQES